MTDISLQNLGAYIYFSIIALLIVAGAIGVVVFSHYIAKYFLIKLIDKVFGKRKGLGRLMFKNRVFHRIAYLIPAVILHHYASIFDIVTKSVKLYLADLVIFVTTVYIMIVTALILSSILNCIHDRYRNLAISKQVPIKSYLQLLKILMFVVTGILIASVITDKSPAYFFTGVGAATAVIMLVFKDSILGFVASIQLAAYDMVRIGDWIEMQNFGADGEVIDISLNTVKVQNFDKTIVTIPSYALLTSGIKNWRGMKEAGGRRVKQSINIDITTIKICDEKMLARFKHLGSFNEKLKSHMLTNNSQITNIGVFRCYLEEYLRQHPCVHKEMKIIVRQLQAASTGLPIELYFFAAETESEKYEVIVGDIFDHVYALLPVFDLRVFQLT